MMINLIIFQNCHYWHNCNIIAWHSQTHNTLYECIHSAYGSSVGSDHDTLCWTKAILTNRGDSQLVVVMPTSHASSSDWFYVYPVLCRDSSVCVQWTTYTNAPDIFSVLNCLWLLILQIIRCNFSFFSRLSWHKPRLFPITLTWQFFIRLTRM